MDIDLKKIYEQYYKDKYFTDTTEKECKNVLAKWKTYRSKIVDEKLSLEDYVSRIENTEDATYMAYFLNNTSSIFGRSREGSANQLMVKLNDDGITYYIDRGKENGTKSNAKLDEAEKLYSDRILPLLKSIIDACGEGIEKLAEVEKAEDYSWFVNKQMLMKMIVLESVSSHNNSNIKFCLPNIYKKDAINDLWNLLCGEGEKEEPASLIEKGHKIMDVTYGLLGIKERTLKTQYEVSCMLWEIEKCDVLETSKEEPNIIIYGSPGTGKTYAVKKAIELLGAKDRTSYVQCHPGFGYEEFVEGIKPVGMTTSGTIQFEVVNGVFKDFCIRAKKEPDKVFYFVADEINRANVSSMFGETLSLIEADYRDDPKPNGKRNLCKTSLSKLIERTIKHNTWEKGADKEKIENIAYEYDDKEGVYFGIPQNIRFIGMMNDVDKSIDTFDLALRRRFKWIRKDCDYDVIEDLLEKEKKEKESIDKYVERCKRLNEYISKTKNDGLGLGKTYEFGHAFFLKIMQISKNKKITPDHCKLLFERHLRPTLSEYLRSFQDEDEIEKNINKAKNLFSEK